MAFIVLRRSRNTRSYALVERYRDERGQVRSRVLCYLGREQDGTDTLEKAHAHWIAEQQRAEASLHAATRKRRQVLTRRLARIEGKLAVIADQQRRAAAVVEHLRRRQEREEAAGYWQAFESLRRRPTAEHAELARRAFLHLAKRCHPDQGGSHEAFIRLKKTYDAAMAEYRYASA
jgi:hypothetical protein